MKVLTEKRPIVGDGEAVSLIHFDARKSKYHYLEYRHRCSLWQSRCSTAFVACCHRIEGIGQHRGVSYLRFAPIATGISLEVPSIALPVLGSVPAAAIRWRIINTSSGRSVVVLNAAGTSSSSE